jgi:lysozyme
MANEDMRLSAAGHQALAHAEAVRRAYYNDQGNNCTFGQGQLVHYGPCTAAEIATRVTDRAIAQARDNSIATAERLVRNTVRAHQLTQDQFDAAVSFVFNTGATSALRPANTGNMQEVANQMGQFVNVCQHDPSTGRVISGTCRLSAGLVARRQGETAPFRNSP